MFVMQAIGLISWTWDLRKDEITCNRSYFTPKTHAATGTVIEKEMIIIHRLSPSTVNGYVELSII